MITSSSHTSVKLSTTHKLNPFRFREAMAKENEKDTSKGCKINKRSKSKENNSGTSLRTIPPSIGKSAVAKVEKTNTKMSYSMRSKTLQSKRSKITLKGRPKRRSTSKESRVHGMKKKKRSHKHRHHHGHHHHKQHNHKHHHHKHRHHKRRRHKHRHRTKVVTKSHSINAIPTKIKESAVEKSLKMSSGTSIQQMSGKVEESSINKSTIEKVPVTSSPKDAGKLQSSKKPIESEHLFSERPIEPKTSVNISKGDTRKSSRDPDPDEETFLDVISGEESKVFGNVTPKKEPSPPTSAAKSLSQCKKRTPILVVKRVQTKLTVLPKLNSPAKEAKKAKKVDSDKSLQTVKSFQWADCVEKKEEEEELPVKESKLKEVKKKEPNEEGDGTEGKKAPKG